MGKALGLPRYKLLPQPLDPTGPTAVCWEAGRVGRVLGSRRRYERPARSQLLPGRPLVYQSNKTGVEEQFRKLGINTKD